MEPMYDFELFCIHAGMTSCILAEIFKPEVLIAVHDQWEKLVNPIKINASGASSTQVDRVLERLKIGLHKLKELPCCIDITQHAIKDIPEYQ